MIKIENLKIKIGETEILKGISLNFEIGKNYLVLGKNGSGKSSLVNFLMGNPKYEFKSGKVEIDGQNLLDLTVDKRSLNGMFLAFQNVEEIPGIKLGEYLRIIFNAHKKAENERNFPEKKFIGFSPMMFKKFVQKYLDDLSIDFSFLERDLNVGFSGGEKRKIEILQAKLLEPKYIFFDEIDSGLDLDAQKNVSQNIQKLDSKENSIIYITHNFGIVDFVNFDEIIVMKNGKISENGGIEILEKIKKNGFN